MPSETAQSPGLPSAADVIAGIEKSDAQGVVTPSEKEYVVSFQRRSIAAQVEYAHLQGIRDHYKHKGNWSTFLMFAVGGMLVFQSILLLAVGTGKLDFSEYDWLLPALLAQNLGQVVGLAIYAVRFLFSDISRKE